jgi:cytochrome b subunit of formate dehydrogenase
MTRASVSQHTLKNWLLDAAVFSGGLIASLTGIYFLFLPVGGYQGGRNPAYGVTILFGRSTWDDLHTWFGVLMIAAAAIHFVFHWGWVANMLKRMAKALSGKGVKMNRHGYFNVAIDAAVALSFLAAALSGLYFLFDPASGRGATTVFLFDRTTWDLIHTWSGALLIAAAAVHFAIHWGWVTKVTAKVFGSLLPAGRPTPRGGLPGTANATTKIVPAE